LDRELPAADIQQAAAHLKECPACDRLCRELAARAARVGELVDLLPELEVETLQIPAMIPRRASGGPRLGWVGAAVALAAALGVVAYLVPRRQPDPPPMATTAAPPVPAPTGLPVDLPVASPVQEPAMALRQARSVARTMRPRRIPDAGAFVALDDEPFESGVIMRMAVTPGKAEADIVFGPDGRARAFRLVQAGRQKY
jgi:hypothetical protein